MNNYELYQRQGSTVHVMIPWDKSEATRFGPTYSIFHNLNDVPASQQNRLMGRIIGVIDLRNQYFDALVQTANSASELIAADGRGWMEREVERENTQIQDAVLADTTKSYSNDQYRAATDDLRTFARERADFVRTEVANAR